MTLDRDSSNHPPLFPEPTGAGVMSWDVMTGALVCSEELDRLFGLAASDRPTIYDVLSRIHPEDAPRACQTLNDALCSKGTYEIAHRVLRGDGSVRVVATRGMVEYGHDGVAQRVHGIAWDITEASRDSDRWFELTIDLLCIAGVDGYFRRLNPAWELALGWSLQELMSRPFIEFVHPEDIDTTLAEMDRLRRGHEALSFDNRYRCRDGTFRWLHWRTQSTPGRHPVRGRYRRDRGSPTSGDAQAAKRRALSVAEGPRAVRPRGVS